MRQQAQNSYLQIKRHLLLMFNQIFRELNHEGNETLVRQRINVSIENIENITTHLVLGIILNVVALSFMSTLQN